MKVEPDMRDHGNGADIARDPVIFTDADLLWRGAADRVDGFGDHARCIAKDCDLGTAGPLIGFDPFGADGGVADQIMKGLDVVVGPVTKPYIGQRPARCGNIAFPIDARYGGADHTVRQGPVADPC